MKRHANLKPRKAVKRTNPKRKAREFQRTYHSKERVAFVKSLVCAFCGAWEASDNAHLPSQSGMGRKGAYTTIIPLCRAHHQDLDAHRLDHWLPRFMVVAAETETRWQLTTPLHGSPA